MQQTQECLVDVAVGYQIGDMVWVVAEKQTPELLAPLPMCGPSRRLLTSTQIRDGMNVVYDKLFGALRKQGLQVY